MLESATEAKLFREKKMGDSVGKSHEVVLLGKKYKLKSTHDETHLSDLATYVTAQVAEVQRKGTASTLDAALLAALNIADELFRVKRETEERLAAIGEKTQTLLSALDEHADPREEREPVDAAAAIDEPEVDAPMGDDATTDELDAMQKADAGR